MNQFVCCIVCQRKPEEDAGADDTKKVKTDGREIDEPAKQTEVTEADTKSEVTGSEQNGCSAAVNGTAANHREVSGCSDGMDVADETEIKVRYVSFACGVHFSSVALGEVDFC